MTIRSRNHTGLRRARRTHITRQRGYVTRYAQYAARRQKYMKQAAVRLCKPEPKPEVKKGILIGRVAGSRGERIRPRVAKPDHRGIDYSKCKPFKFPEGWWNGTATEEARIPTPYRKRKG